MSSEECQKSRELANWEDLQNKREVYLIDTDIEIIRRLCTGYYPNGSMRDNDYYVEYDDTPQKI